MKPDETPIYPETYQQERLERVRELVRELRPKDGCVPHGSDEKWRQLIDEITSVVEGIRSGEPEEHWVDIAQLLSNIDEQEDKK